MTPAGTVILFDIDGTLIHSAGLGRRALTLGMERLHGSAHALNTFSFAGMTDRAIFRRGLGEHFPAPHIDARIDELLETYLGILQQLLDQGATCTPHPGITSLLPTLAATPAVALGLGTGNVRRGAELKLESAGLNEYFAFGGFGDDDELRANVLEAGARRGARRLGLPRTACRVVVIGDTPKDIEAARAIGAEAIAVATGPHPLHELRAHEPDHEFEHLDDAGVLAAILCPPHPPRSPASRRET